MNNRGYKKLIKQLTDLTECNEEAISKGTPPSLSSSTPSLVETSTSVHDRKSSRSSLDRTGQSLPRISDRRQQGGNSSETSGNNPDMVVSFHQSDDRQGPPSVSSSMPSSESSPASLNMNNNQYHPPNSYIQSIRRRPGEVEFFKLLHSEFHKAVYFFDRAIDEFSIREERVLFGMNIIRHKERVQLWTIFVKSVFRLYTDLLLLETFCIMTYCSFSKILKKHDKHTGFETKNAFMANVVNNANFTHYTTLQQMIDRCQEVYSEVSNRLEREGLDELHEDER
jgi:hypothetical protein